MAIIDQTITYRNIEAELENTTNPRHRRMLERLYQHSRAERTEDLETVLGTLAPNPAFRSSSPDPAMNPTGWDAVRRFYIEEIFDKGRHILEFIKERILVGDNHIITQGLVRSLHWGQDLVDMGMSVDDADGYYMLTYRMLIVWPYDDEQRIIGEESWSQRSGEDYVRKISEADLPENFVRFVARRRQERAAAAG